MKRLLMKNESSLPDLDAWELIVNYLRDPTAVKYQLKKNNVEIRRGGGTVTIKDKRGGITP